jgi:hypothetical protein
MVEFTELIIKLPSNQRLVNLDSVGHTVKKLPTNLRLVNLDRRGGGIAFPLLQ